MQVFVGQDGFPVCWALEAHQRTSVGPDRFCPMKTTVNNIMHRQEFSLVRLSNNERICNGFSSLKEHPLHHSSLSER